LGPRRFVTLVRSAVYKLSYLLTYLLTYHVWKYGRHPVCDRWD